MSRTIADKFPLYISVLFFAIGTYLSVFVDWRFDEVWSFREVSHYTSRQIIDYEPYVNSNNHVLNSLQMRFFCLLGLKNVFFFRIVSLISLVIYSVYYTKIINFLRQDNNEGKTKTESVIFSGLFPFILPCFLYFAMARGHSIALAAGVVSFYYFLRFNRQQHLVHFILFAFWGLVSSISIFTFIYSFGAMLLYMVVVNFTYLRTNILTVKYGATLMVFTVIFTFVAWYIYDNGKIINVNSNAEAKIIDTFFKNGFLSSVISYLSFQDFLLFPLWIFKILRVAMSASLIATLFLYYKNRKLAGLTVSHILAGILLLVIILAKVVLHANYPFMRSVPMLLFFFYLPLLMYSPQRKAERIIYSVHFVLIITLGIINTAEQMRLPFYYNPQVPGLPKELLGKG